MSSHTAIFATKLATFIIAACAVGCSTSSVTSSRVQRSSVPIRTIAISPSSSMFGDAVGIELANRGFNVIDSGQAASLLVTSGLDEVRVYRPEDARPLVARGIDAMLSVRSSVGYDGRPQSATIKLVSLRDGKILVGANWQNGWGGMPGSPADRMSRDDLVEAAGNIANTIERALR